MKEDSSKHAIDEQSSDHSFSNALFGVPHDRGEAIANELIDLVNARIEELSAVPESPGMRSKEIVDMARKMNLNSDDERACAIGTAIRIVMEHVEQRQQPDPMEQLMAMFAGAQDDNEDNQ